MKMTNKLAKALLENFNNVMIIQEYLNKKEITIVRITSALEKEVHKNDERRFGDYMIIGLIPEVEQKIIELKKTTMKRST